MLCNFCKKLKDVFRTADLLVFKDDDDPEKDTMSIIESLHICEDCFEEMQTE